MWNLLIPHDEELRMLLTVNIYRLQIIINNNVTLALGYTFDLERIILESTLLMGVLFTAILMR